MGAVIKLKHPKTGEVRAFHSDHADRILRIQRERGYPKGACWTMAEKPPKKEVKDSNKSQKESKAD